MSENTLSRRIDLFPVAGRVLNKSYLFTKWSANLVAGALGWAVGLLAALDFFAGLVQPDKDVVELVQWFTGGTLHVIEARVCMLLGLIVGGTLLGLCSASLTNTWNAFPFRKRAPEKK